MARIEIPTELPNILRNFTLSILRAKPQDIIGHAVDYFTRLQQQQQQQRPVQDKNSITINASSSPTSTTHHQQQQQEQQPLQASNHDARPPGDSSLTDIQQFSADNENEMTSADTDETTVPTHLSSEHRSVVSFASEKTDRQSISDDDDDDEDNNSLGDLDEEDAMRRQYVKRNEFRRVSVAAERYNPEDDDDSDGEQSVVYSKTPEQRQRLKDAVCHNLLFRTLEAKQIDQILDAMWEKHVEQGDTIIQQGDDGDHFYVIDSGVYDIFVSKEPDFLHPIKVGEYDQSGSFGELALMYNQPRSATIIASTDGIVWAMGRQTFRKLVLKHAFRKRQLYERFLRDLTILQSLTDYERSNVADALIPVEFDENDVIIKQGDEGDRMFFIEDGHCDIYMNDTFHKRLSKGDYFGELALLNHEPRSATVTAASEKVKLASLQVESFERLLGPCMDVIHRNTSKYRK